MFESSDLVLVKHYQNCNNWLHKCLFLRLSIVSCNSTHIIYRFYGILKYYVKRLLQEWTTVIANRRSFIADIDNSGYVSDFELQELFREASFNIPGYKVREIVEKFMEGDTNKDEKLSFEEFVAVSLTMSLCLILKC